MDTCLPLNDSAILGGSAAPLATWRSMASHGIQHGPVVEDPSEPGAAKPSGGKADSTPRLVAGGEANEGIAGQSSSTRVLRRQMDGVGQEPCDAATALRSQKRSGLDFARLRPGELTRLLNSTPLGTVISERQLFRHRKRAGNQIGEGKHIDFARYVAWLCLKRHDPLENQEVPVAPPASRTVRVAGQKFRVRTIVLPEVLKLLKKQAYCCALTGRKLTPDAAALDHIVPISRGGEHCARNAQVLHDAVNRAKGTLTNEDFIQICREVVAHVDRDVRPSTGRTASAD